MSRPTENRPWDDSTSYWVSGQTLNDLHEQGVVENRLELDDALAEIFFIDRVPGKPAVLRLADGATIADCE
jgi:hypothetical protein